MNRACGNCRHYYALAKWQDRGTCRLGAPKLIKGTVACMPSDDLDVERWPWVRETECCARFDWRCREPGCREPVMKPSPATLRTGAFFCVQHYYHAAPGASAA